MDQEQKPPLDTSVAVTLKESKKRNAPIDLPGKQQLKEIIKKLKQFQEEESDDEIPYSESEMLDALVRTRKTTQLIMSMLPKLDKADENRAARAREPIPEIHPK